jgi:uncharacterized protein YbjQ (UPF0145 family)
VVHRGCSRFEAKAATLGAFAVVSVVLDRSNMEIA